VLLPSRVTEGQLIVIVGIIEPLQMVVKVAS